MSNAQRRRMTPTPPLEAGVAPTVNEENIHVPPDPTPLYASESPQDGPSAPEGPGVVSVPTTADEPRLTARLTADEVNDLRRRMEAVDFLAEEVRVRKEALDREVKAINHLDRGRAAAQRDLTAYVQSLISAYALAPGMSYRADPDQAAILPVGPAR